MTDSNGSLMAALLAVQNELPKLQRDAINPHFRNKYISLDSLMSAIRPVLNKHGLVWITKPGQDERGEPVLTYRLVHAESNESEDGTMPLMLAKADSQGQGSALTYARRYSISAVLGLVADEDDDGHKASERERQRQSSPAQVDKAAIAELQAAAKGLNPDQIKLAFTACGIGIPDPLVWNAVPQAKAAAMCEALAGITR